MAEEMSGELYIKLGKEYWIARKEHTELFINLRLLQ
jgi:hypothetical protein